MRACSVCILSALGLVALVLATQASHARALAPGEAAPPLQSLDLTKPGGPRPSAVTQQAAPAPAPAPAPALAAPTAKPSTRQPPATTKAAPVKAKPGTAVATTGPARKTLKAPPKAAKGKPALRPTTSTAGDR